METIGEGSIVKTLYPITVTSYATGRSWEVPVGKHLRVLFALNGNFAFECETLDGKTFVRACLAVIKPLNPLEQLAACAED